jgi:outer membrane protein, heavy metal efflux system
MSFVSPSKLCAASVAIAITASATSATAAPSVQSAFTLKQAVARAVERNPLVVESALEWRRAQGAAAGVAGVLAENPVLGVESGLHRDVGWSGNQGGLAVRVEQPIDVLGQAGARRRAADGVVRWAESRLALVRSEITARTHLLYVAAQIARVRLALDEERLANAEKTAQALDLRVRLGASSDIDLHMAWAEVARAQATLQNAHSVVVESGLALRDLLDLPAQAEVSPSDAFAPPKVASNTAKPIDEAGLLAHHLSVKAVERRGLAIDGEIARLERERLPRLAVGLWAERPSNQESFFGVGLSISPALWRRNQGPLAEARVEREKVEAERATTLAGLERRWAALAEMQTRRAEELAAVERALEAEETVRRLVREGWQAGKFDFLRVLLAERSVADMRQSRLDLWAELWRTEIERNRLLGREP